MICSAHLHDLDSKCPECRKIFKPEKAIPFCTIIKSPLVDDKHKQSMLASNADGRLVFNSEVIADRLLNAAPSGDYMSERNLIWRKVSRAKGIYRSAEQIKIDEEEKSSPKKKQTKEE